MAGQRLRQLQRPVLVQAGDPRGGLDGPTVDEDGHALQQRPLVLLEQANAPLDKRTAGLAMRSRLVVADAAETRLCAWLSVSTFAGLLAYALVGWTWLDPAAGFVIAAFALKEGREAWEGELVCDND